MPLIRKSSLIALVTFWLLYPLPSLASSVGEYLMLIEKTRSLQSLASKGQLNKDSNIPPQDFVARDCQVRGDSLKMLIFDCLVAQAILDHRRYIADADTIVNYVVEKIGHLSSEDKKILVPVLYDVSSAYRKYAASISSTPEFVTAKKIQKIAILTVKEACKPADILKAHYLIFYARDLYLSGDENGADLIMDEVRQEQAPKCSAETAKTLIQYLIGTSDDAYVSLMSKAGFYKMPKLSDWSLKQSIKISMLSDEQPRARELRLRLGEKSKIQKRK